MKAPVGLLSDRTVLRSKMEGLCPDKFAFVKVMPSDPKTIPFYARYGFQQYDNYSAMVRKHFL